MAHSWDSQQGYFSSDELRERRACHVENILRAEQGYGLRQRYGPDHYQLLDENGLEVYNKYDYKNNLNVERNNSNPKSLIVPVPRFIDPISTTKVNIKPKLPL